MFGTFTEKFYPDTLETEHDRFEVQKNDEGV